MRASSVAATTIALLTLAAPARAVTIGYGPSTSVAPLVEAAGQPFTTAVQSTDPCPDDTPTVDWGDGSDSSPVTVVGGAFGCDLIAGHTYASPGNYTLTVTGSWYGTTLSITTAVYVRPFDLAATRARKGTVGAAVGGAWASFHAPFSFGNYAAHIDWGDGQSSDVDHTEFVGDTLALGEAPFETVNAYHTYTQPGSYPVTIDLLQSGRLAGEVVTRVVVGSCAPPTGDAYVPAVGDAYDRWLSLVFHDVLGRAPSDSERAGARAALAAGASRTAILLPLVAGGESEARRTTSLYASLLGRAPTQAELSSSSPLADIVGGHEYADLVRPASAQTDGGVLTQAMTCDLLGRPATDAEISAAQALATHDAVAAFLNGAAFREAAVDTAYRTYLRRPATSHEQLAGAALSPEQLAAAVAASPEYFQRANGGGVLIAPRIGPRGQIVANLGRRAQLRLRVFGPRGALGTVRLGAHARGTVAISWHGRIGRRALARGRYTVVLEALDHGRVIDATDAVPIER